MNNKVFAFVCTFWANYQSFLHPVLSNHAAMISNARSSAVDRFRLSKINPIASMTPRPITRRIMSEVPIITPFFVSLNSSCSMPPWDSLWYWYLSEFFQVAKYSPWKETWHDEVMRWKCFDEVMRWKCFDEVMRWKCFDEVMRWKCFDEVMRWKCFDEVMRWKCFDEVMRWKCFDEVMGWKCFDEVMRWKCFDEVMGWKCFDNYWPFMRGIHPWPVTSHHKRPVIRSFDVFYFVGKKNLMNK